MAYRPNPFLERVAERSTSDQEFVKLFSPRVIEHLDDSVFEGGVHIFRSPPGGGKTTLLRAFAPPALRAFWNARWARDMGEAYQQLVSVQVLDKERGPQLLGVLLSCASGYADLPPGATHENQGLLRGLLNCRVVLRTLRSLAALLGLPSLNELEKVSLEYGEPVIDLQEIPSVSSAADLAQWAERWERRVFGEIDSLGTAGTTEAPAHGRLEGLLWLQGVRFRYANRIVAPRRMLMIDDLHKLRRQQHALLIEELTELRSSIPVWLAERSIALGDQLLSQGVRDGRDVREYALGEIWGTTSRNQFALFAENILERRLAHQDALPTGSFSPYLRAHFEPEEWGEQIAAGIAECREELAGYASNRRYTDWVSEAEPQLADPSVESLKRLLVTRILLGREDNRRQLTLELGPLSKEEHEARGTSPVQAAAEIFMHEQFKISYYFGMERLCLLATSNVEELLVLAAALYEALLAKQILRRDLILSPQEQERLITEVARRRKDFIPKNHTEGTRAQRLIDSIGGFCREKTFAATAPYAPGVTGVRLSDRELELLRSAEEPLATHLAPVRRVLAECVAENLLFKRPSAESGSRESGTVFYLNRTLCAHYGLPLQLGGWQDLAAEDLLSWMNKGRTPRKLRRLEIGQ